MDGFSKISAGNEFYAHIRYIQLNKLALLILLFTILKSHVEYYLQATACMTKKYQYLKHTDKFDLKFSIEQWMGGAVRLSYIYRTKQKTCTTGGQMILLDENATKVSYIQVNIMWYAAIHFLY